MTTLALLGVLCAAFVAQALVAMLVTNRRSPRMATPDMQPAPSEPVRRQGSLGRSLFRRDVLPFYLSLLALGGAALVIDAVLHWFDMVWIGRYLGILGVLLIIASSAYSMRKRKWIKPGKTVTLLRWHERLAWAGSLLILVHAGIHFNAILAWLAVWAMLINIASGLTGKYLLGPRQQADRGNQIHFARSGADRRRGQRSGALGPADARHCQELARDPFADNFGVFGASRRAHHFHLFVLGVEMTQRWGIWLIAINLCVLIVLAFI